MENKYKTTKTTVSMINYHFVFCPRYRRKIFLIEGVEKHFKELVNTISEEMNLKVIALECDIDHVHLFINAKPTISPSKIMYHLKRITSRIIRKEFNELKNMPSLWTRSYFVSTAGEVSSETIKKYVENQKKQ
jgi:putative transposase